MEHDIDASLNAKFKISSMASNDKQNPFTSLTDCGKSQWCTVMCRQHVYISSHHEIYGSISIIFKPAVNLQCHYYNNMTSDVNLQINARYSLWFHRYSRTIRQTNLFPEDRKRRSDKPYHKGFLLWKLNSSCTNTTHTSLIYTSGLSHFADDVQRF